MSAKINPGRMSNATPRISNCASLLRTFVVASALKNSAFLLTKWYLDSVSPKGEVFIGYAARVRWRSIGFGYAGHILSDGSTLVKSNRFEPGPLPVISGSSVGWTTPDLTGTWEASGKPLSQTLLDSPEGRIQWTVCCPKANSFVRVRNSDVKGLGYVELMEITIPPWRIPIRELYWGRFLSQSQYVIWIEWKGPVPKQLIFLNGTPVHDGAFSDDGISFDRYEVVIKTRTLLRSGSISSTVFRGLRKIKALFPRSIFALQETKWTGRASLKRDGKEIDEGNYIHEKVIW